jgi:hypothetical protein
VGFRSRKIVRSKSTVGVAALLLAVAVLGAGTAFAQTPGVPATTIAGQPDDQSGLDPHDGEDKPKAEKPKADAPNPETPKTEAPEGKQPDAEAPKAGKPEAEAPKPETPKTGPPKADKPDAKAPKPETPTTEPPKADKPNPEKSEPAAPKPTTESPTPAQPGRAPDGATSAQPNEPRLKPQRLKPQVDVANPVSPRPKPPSFVAASPVRHVSTARSSAGEPNRTAVRGPASAASREWRTISAGGRGDSADATPVASGPAAVAPRRATHLASARQAAGAAASLDRQQPRTRLLGGPPRDNALIPLLLAILYGAGVAYVIRREARRALGLGTRRPAPPRRGARPSPAANGGGRVDPQLRRRPLRTPPSRPGPPRSARATLLLTFENTPQSRRGSRLPR